MEKCVDANKIKYCLLINEKYNYIYCLCSSAFYVAEFVRRSKNILKDINAIVVCEGDKQIYKIVKIKKRGLYGNGLLQKIKSFIYGNYNIEIQLKESGMDFNDLKHIIQNIINNNPQAYEFLFIAEGEDVGRKIVLKKLKYIKDIDELLDLFNCNSDEVCLDAF